MCTRASGASELRICLHFHIKKLLFLSIFCWYFRNFVDTNDILVGSHVPTDFQMYRQISKYTDKTQKKHYWGGGQLPPLATLVYYYTYTYTYIYLIYLQTHKKVIHTY